MKILKQKELEEVKGGALGSKLVMAIVTGGAFMIGLIDGLIKLKWQDLKNIVFIRNLSEKPLIQIRKKDSIMFIKS